MREFLKQDWIITSIIFLLLGLSLAVLYSTSTHNFYRQIVFVCLGLALMFFIYRINYLALKNYSLLFYCLSLAFLILVLIFGRQIRGSSSWFNIGNLGFQPVELVKLIIIIILAKYFAQYSSYTFRWQYIFISMLYLILPIGLIFLQPDLGSIIVLLAIWLGMILMTNVRLLHIGIIMLIFIIIAGIGWSFFLKDYQKNRVLVFLNPQLDPLGSGYNIIQSIVAIGSGGLFGKGLGYGSQSQLKFLPERHTDFIFAAMAEELGFFFVFFIIALFGILFFRAFKIVLNAQDGFGYFLGLGIITYLFVHLFINIGMNIGLLPITGIPLPLISYGGSNLLITLMAIGLLQSIKIKGKI